MNTKNALSSNKSERKKRVAGVANIKGGDEKVRITFDNDEFVFDSGKNSKTLSYDDLPKIPKILPGSDDDYFVVLSSDRDTVQSIGPVEGVFSARCVDLSRPKDDADPEPFEVNPKEGEPYLAFNAFFEIQSGPFKKIRIPFFLHYKFEESRQFSGMAAWMDGNDVWKGRQTHLGRLKEFCERMEIVSEPIEWPEDGNILPVLLERLLENNKAVKIVVSNGYINSIVYSHRSDEQDENKIEQIEQEEKKPKSRKVPHVRKGEEDDEL